MNNRQKAKHFKKKYEELLKNFYDYASNQKYIKAYDYNVKSFKTKLEFTAQTWKKAPADELIKLAVKPVANNLEYLCDFKFSTKPNDRGNYEIIVELKYIDPIYNLINAEKSGLNFADEPTISGLEFVYDKLLRSAT